jgi:hypothetical protein
LQIHGVPIRHTLAKDTLRFDFPGLEVEPHRSRRRRQPTSFDDVGPDAQPPGVVRARREYAEWLQESERPPLHLLRILPGENMTVAEMDAPLEGEVR